VCVRGWAKENSFVLKGATAIIQGYGNVGTFASKFLVDLGVKVIAVGDHTGYISKEGGLDVQRLFDYSRSKGSIAGYEDCKVITREQFFQTKADIFIPAAMENTVGAQEAQWLDVKMISEGANGPTNPDAEPILAKKGITVVPDILANAGGVTVSYFEWIQNKRSEFWELEEVEARLEKRMVRQYRKVMGYAKNKGVSPRIAAYALALLNLKTAYDERGIFP
jgi:glutamate dehydrogenase (NAD(P)+)